MAAHLSSGRVNLTALREAGRRELREFLDKCAGSKVGTAGAGGRRGPAGAGAQGPACGVPGLIPPSLPAGHRVGRVPDRPLRAHRAVLAAQGKRRGSRGRAVGPRRSRTRLTAVPPRQEHEVEKMFTLKPGRLPPADVKNIIFFVRPKLELMDIITDNVLRYRGQSSAAVRKGQVWPESPCGLSHLRRERCADTKLQHSHSAA